MVGRKCVILLLVLLFLGISSVALAETTVYTVEEGKSIVLSFTNPTNETLQIQVKNLSYPKSTIPVWLSMSTIPPQQTVDVILHFYVVNDGVSGGTYAIAVYTPYQSYLIYLKKAGAEESSSSDSTEWVRLYQDMETLRLEVQQLTALWEQRYNQLYKEVQDLKKSDSADAQKITLIEKELQTINNEINDIKKLMDNMNAQIQSMLKTVQANDKKVTSFETTLKSYEKTLQNYDKQISVINAQLQSIDIEKYKELDARVKQIETKIAKMEQAVSDAKTMANAAQSSAMTAQARIREVEDNNKFLLVGALAGIVAFGAVLVSGGFKFNFNNKRNGGLPRRSDYEKDLYAVPQGIHPKKVSEQMKKANPQEITLTKQELAALLEEAATKGAINIIEELAAMTPEEEIKSEKKEENKKG